MDKATINFAHLCDTAFLSQQGKLNIIGIFEQVAVKKFPVRHPKITLALNLSLQEGIYPFKIRLIHVFSNTEVTKLEGELNCKKAGKTGLINEFVDIRFQESGEYAFEIWIDNEPTGKVSFKVVSHS